MIVLPKRKHTPRQPDFQSLVNSFHHQGECADEFFLVTGGSAVPPICGVNNAQHVIYSVTPDSGPSQLSVILSVQSTQSSNARLWNMRVYQYECTSPVLAPVGCLQHFTGASGMVRTRLDFGGSVLTSFDILVYCLLWN